MVSTNTINLQEQLVGKDLPFLRDALRTDTHEPSFALLKGWRNYLCLARLHQAVGAQRTRVVTAAVFVPNKALEDLRGCRVAGAGAVETLPLR